MTVSPFERARAEGCLSDFALDRIVGERTSHPHLESCERCAARHRELAGARDAFRLPTQKRRRWPMGLGIAIAASFAALFVLPAQNVRSKGGPSVSFWVKHGDAVRRGNDGERVAPNDAIRFAYSMDRAHHVAVLSIDPNGAVSVYYPNGEPTHAETPGSDVALPLSTILDDSLGSERIFALFCDDPIDLDRAKRQLSDARDLALDRCQTRRLAWQKER